MWDIGCLLGMAIFIAVFVAPVFWRAHGKAAQEACLCNFKQLTLSLLTYTSDNDGRLPNMLVWAPVLKPYYRNEAVLYCQSDRRLPLSQRLTGADEKWPARASFISYGMLQRWSYQKLPPKAQAGQAIALYEVGDQGLDYRHSGGMWLGLLDGHAKFYLRSEMAPAAILTGVTHEAPGTQWQPSPR